MRKFFLLLPLLFVFLSSSYGQLLEPVKWEFTQEKVSEEEYDLVFSATIEPTWHLYAQQLPPENYSLPTQFIFDSIVGVELIDSVIAHSEIHEEFEELSGAMSRFFSNEAVFKQRVKVIGDVAVVTGFIDYMACDDGQCVKLDNSFEFPIRGSDGSASAETTSAADQSGDDSDESGMWMIFFLSFLGGLAALLTPCVFPMIPMTVSFFTKSSTTKAKGIRNAIQYGLFIILIYILLGTIVVVVFGADALNALSTNPWFNVAFFLLLLVFAISFLGAFEIVLPSSWVNKADKGSDKGGIVGSFFMALTLALVSFSCTGPIVGTLLVKAASSGGMAPLIGMFGFSLALALPFMFFAAFPGYLNSLPKSGGWLNSVKVVLGFLELAFAFKFLSNADLVLNLHLLEREVYLAIWIAIFGALGFYFLGKLRLPHDSLMEKIPVGRLMLGLITLSFTIYMIPGMWGAPLKLISAFPPPLEYSESPNGVGNRALQSQVVVSGHTQNGDLALYNDKMKPGPQGLSVFDDYYDALEYAKKVGKPLMIDFTGKACVNCREMEIKVWSDPTVNRLMREEYVVVALYVDYREKLSKEKQYVSEITGKKIKTVGNQWSDFQISRYNINAQPYYVLLDHDEELLVKPKAYDLNIQSFIEFLDNGKTEFKNR